MRRLRARWKILFGVLGLVGFLSLVQALVLAPKVMSISADSKAKIAGMAVHKYADEAYVQWRREHAELCPRQLKELNEYMNNKDTRDPWGMPYIMFCDETHPMTVMSTGEDGKYFTVDDIWSNRDD